jgi:hypothetical protein
VIWERVREKRPSRHAEKGRPRMRPVDTNSGHISPEHRTEVASGGAGSLPTLILGMTAAGPSAHVRPRVTDGGGGKAGNHDGDTGEGAGKATLSACGERTATDEAGGYEFRTSVRNIVRMGDRWCRVLAHTDPRYGARVRTRVTDGGGGKAGDHERDMGEGAEQATLSACGKRTAVEEADCYGGYEDDRSGQREDPSTPGPETSAVARGCGRKTREKGGGHEEARPGMGTDGRTGGKAGSRDREGRTEDTGRAGGFGVGTETTGVGESSPRS